jgi:hypothetical protein
MAEKTSTPELSDLVKPAPDRYVEDESYLPNPYFQYGTVDTSDTAGGAHQSVAEVSPVFALARAANLVTAARALDPEDDGVGAELVTLPESTTTVVGPAKTADEAREEVATALSTLAADPVLLGGPTEQQKLAAEERDDEEDSGVTTTTAPNRATTSTTASTTRPSRASK